MAEEFIRDSANWIKHYQLVADAVQEITVKDDDKDILTFVIRCASGHRITALSSRPSNLRGKQGYVIIDEAAFHDQLGELIKATIALLMWGGKVAVISTHDGVDNPFNQLCKDIKAGKKPYALHRTTFDEACEQGLYERICQVRGIEYSPAGETEWKQAMYDQYGNDADEELRVIPSNSGGAVLSRALLLLRGEDVPVLRLAKRDDWAQYPEHLRRAEIADWCNDHLLPMLTPLDSTREHVFGMDFARSGDYMDEAIAIVTLGQVMTSQAVGGQYKADVQDGVKDDIIKADADLLCASFNETVVKWLTEWNFPNANPPKLWLLTKDEVDNQAQSTAFSNMTKLGYRSTLEHVKDTFGGEWEVIPVGTGRDLSSTNAM